MCNRDGDLMPPGGKHVRGVERAAYAVAALLVLSGLFHLAVLIVGGGTWEGPVSFRKPATFGLSFGAVLFAVIWQLSFLKLTKRMHILAVSVFAAACALQTALVVYQK
jgi:hypothetical protein